MGRRRSPNVSVGFPVYNGSQTLTEAIESLLGQTYQDIELIICDNASTDDTQELCRAFAERDSRVRYFRNSRNIGSHKNHNKTVELARGEYFMWSGDDDIRLPEYVSSCLKILEDHPIIVLCCSDTMSISKSGDPLPSSSPGLRDCAHESAVVRFADLIRMDHQIEPIYGLVRMSVLRKTGLFGQFADTDRVLLAELGLHGPFALLDRPLLQRRVRTEGGRVGYPSRQDRTLWFEPEKPNMIVFPYSRQLVEYVRAIRRAPLNAKERRACIGLMMKWVRRHCRLLLSDYQIALKDLLRPAYYFLTGRDVRQAGRYYRE